VPVKNEIANIERCLQHLEWADEVFVVDSQSTDGTIEKAEAMGAQVVQFHFRGSFPKKKNWALENLPFRNEWVLIVDADEFILPALADEIAETLKAPDCDGYYVNRKFWFLGGWIRHCGYYPSWNLRLLKHKLGRYERLEISGDTGSGDNEVHEHVILQGKAGHLRNDMDHRAYPDLYTWIEKHNRYSNWEAHCARSESGTQEQIKASPFGSALERRRWVKRLAGRLPFRPFLRFLYHYVLKRGFQDGYRGYVMCRLMGWYEFVSAVKAKEMGLKEAAEGK
jgi:glycosyltransferase involved in cell wall biosynthesis